MVDTLIALAIFTYGIISIGMAYGMTAVYAECPDKTRHPILVVLAFLLSLVIWPLVLIWMLTDNR